MSNETFITSVEQAFGIVRKLESRIRKRIASSELKDLVATMYGYANWGAFCSSSRQPESAFDQEVDDRTRRQRKEMHIAALVAFGFGERAAKSFAEHVKPTVKTPEHKKFEQRRAVENAANERLATVSQPFGKERRVIDAVEDETLNPDYEEFEDDEWEERQQFIDERRERILNGTRRVATKASVPLNSTFRGIPIKVVKEILKRHASWFFPPLPETASRAAINLDMPTALGLHQELLAEGFLAHGATEEGIVYVHGTHDTYEKKFVHITDKGKSVFRPGTQGILQTSIDFDPDILVVLEDVNPNFDMADPGWFGQEPIQGYDVADPIGYLENHYAPREYGFRSRVVRRAREPRRQNAREASPLVFEFGLNSEVTLTLDRTASFSDERWELRFCVAAVGPKGANVRYRNLYDMTEDAIIQMQSVIALFAGADLWRLAHRRELIGKDTTEIALVIDIQKEGSVQGLGKGLTQMAASRTSFVNHIDKKIGHRISITAEGSDPDGKRGSKLRGFSISPPRIIDNAIERPTKKTIVAGVDPDEFLKMLNRKDVDHRALIEKYGELAVHAVVSRHLLPNLRDRALTGKHARILAKLIGSRRDVDSAFENLSDIAVNALRSGSHYDVMAGGDKDYRYQDLAHQLTYIFGGKGRVLTPRIWSNLRHLLHPGLYRSEDLAKTLVSKPDDPNAHDLAVVLIMADPDPYVSSFKFNEARQIINLTIQSPEFRSRLDRIIEGEDLSEGAREALLWNIAAKRDDEDSQRIVCRYMRTCVENGSLDSVRQLVYYLRNSSWSIDTAILFLELAQGDDDAREVAEDAFRTRIPGTVKPMPRTIKGKLKLFAEHYSSKEGSGDDF